MEEIKVERLARVEGDGGITVEIEDKRVKDVRVNIFEGPRLFEELVKGKSPKEVLNIVPRICGICTLSHRYAALRSMEGALGIRIPLKVKLLRTLMHYGEIMESHSLHIYLLSLPDLLGYPSAIAMAESPTLHNFSDGALLRSGTAKGGAKYGEEVKKGLEIKKFANRVMEITSGRILHGENPILGGFGKFPAKGELLEIRKRSEELIPYIEDGINLLGSIVYPTFCEKETTFMCLKPDEGYGFVGDKVLVSDGEEVPVSDYRNLISERVVSHSFAKRSRYKNLPFTVGAIARMNLLGEKLTGKAKKYFEWLYRPRWEKNPLFNILAQAIEILFCLGNIPPIIDALLSLNDSEITEQERINGEATGAVEAPRGVLYHYYRVEDGIIRDCDIVTPTAQNLDDIEEHLKVSAENLLLEGEKDLELKLETVVRAYDPCISCSAHMIKVKGDR